MYGIGLLTGFLLGCMFMVTASCAGPAVIDAGAPCSPVGLDEALLDACERWPETCEVGQRMDFMCVTANQIASVSRCARPVDACTMRVGGGPYRGRVYVREGIDVADAARHEAQHWHLWDDVDSNACESHDAGCGWIED